jgi:BACON domain-containing protein
MTPRRMTALIGALVLLSAAAAPAAAAAPRPDGDTPPYGLGPRPAVGAPGTGAPIEQTGGTVLFDQLTSRAQTGVGMPAGRFDPPHPVDAEGADDFQVFDEEGWTIGEVVVGTPDFGMRGKHGFMDVRVYPDAGGAPGEPALCGYDRIPAEQHGVLQVRVPLPAPCVLGPGRYWLSLQQRDDVLRWAVASPNPLPPPFVLGARAHWRNPGDGWATGCTAWSEISTCQVAGEPVTGGFDSQALFQVCGAVGTAAAEFAGCGNENAGLDVAVTLAVDNGDPEQCGTATTLDAEAGDRVNVCYTVTNTGNAPLAFHWLRDNVDVRPLSSDQVVAPGQTLRFNRLITAARSRVIAAESQATDQLPWYFSHEEGFEFVDIAGTGTPLDLGDDGSTNVTMPFRFNLFGISSDQLCINNNGFVLLDWDRPCDGFHDDVSVPNENVPIGTGQLAPFWDDLFTGGNVYHGVVGEAPDRRFVVQWDEKNHYNDGASDAGGVTFELILDEATHAISFQYQDTTFDNPQHPEWDNAGRATVGFQSLVRDGFGGPWRQHSFNQPSVVPNLGLTWHSTGFFHATGNASATLNVAVPGMAVAPETLSATVEQGGTASLPLTISNSGARDLRWQVGAAPGSGSQLPPGPVVTAASAAVDPDQDVELLGWARWQKPAHATAGTGLRNVDSFATRAYASRFEFLTPPFGPRYQRINDLTQPADTVELASLVGRDVFAGEFIGNDFRRQFAIDECCRQLFTIDTETGETSINLGRILGVPQVAVWRGLAWDATSDTLYVVGTDTFAALPDTRFFLARLDLGHEVVATLIGELPGIAQGISLVDIAVDPAGRMFGVDIQGNQLFAIDKQTAAAVPIGPLGFNAGGALGLDFDDATNTLYLASLDLNSEIGSLYTVDTLTGGASVVGQLGDGSQHAALAIASGAPCVPPTEVSWLTVSPTEGSTAAGGSDEVTVSVDATGLAVGTHQATVCVAGNDPATPLVQVPVSLTVTEGDGGVACDETITGTHSGPLTVDEGVTCLAAGSRVLGEVNVLEGAGLIATAAVVQGPISAVGATTVEVVFSQVTGPVLVSGATGEVSLFASQVTGSVSLLAGGAPSTVSGNTIIGSLSCFGNVPPPTDQGLPNTATGGKLGQCADL